MTVFLFFILGPWNGALAKIYKHIPGKSNNIYRA